MSKSSPSNIENQPEIRPLDCPPDAARAEHNHAKWIQHDQSYPSGYRPTITLILFILIVVATPVYFICRFYASSSSEDELEGEAVRPAEHALPVALTPIVPEAPPQVAAIPAVKTMPVAVIADAPAPEIRREEPPPPCIQITDTPAPVFKSQPPPPQASAPAVNEDIVSRPKIARPRTISLSGSVPPPAGPQPAPASPPSPSPPAPEPVAVPEPAAVEQPAGVLPASGFFVVVSKHTQSSDHYLTCFYSEDGRKQTFRVPGPVYESAEAGLYYSVRNIREWQPISRIE